MKNTTPTHIITFSTCGDDLVVSGEAAAKITLGGNPTVDFVPAASGRRPLEMMQINLHNGSIALVPMAQSLLRPLPGLVKLKRADNGEELYSIDTKANGLPFAIIVSHKIELQPGEQAQGFNYELRGWPWNTARPHVPTTAQAATAPGVA